MYKGEFVFRGQQLGLLGNSDAPHLHFQEDRPIIDWQGLWQRIFNLFFGYGYFIAHRFVDGKPYTAALYDATERAPEDAEGSASADAPAGG